MEAKRIEVSALLRAGHKKSEIAKRLKVSRMTVHRVADRLRNSQTLKVDLARADTKLLKGKRSGKPSMIRLSKWHNWRRERRFLWQQCPRLLRVKDGKFEALEETSVKHCNGSEASRERCRRLLNDFKSHGNWIIIVSDEKTFTVDPVMNKQNERVFSSVCHESPRFATCPRPSTRHLWWCLVS